MVTGLWVLGSNLGSYGWTANAANTEPFLQSNFYFLRQGVMKLRVSPGSLSSQGWLFLFVCFVFLLTSDIWAFYIPLFIQSSQRDSSVIYAVDQGKCSYQSKLLWHLQVCGLCAHVGLWVCAPACLRTEAGVLYYFALFLGGRFSTETGAWVWSLGWLQAYFFFVMLKIQVIFDFFLGLRIWVQVLVLA